MVSYYNCIQRLYLISVQAYINKHQKEPPLLEHFKELHTLRGKNTLISPEAKKIMVRYLTISRCDQVMKQQINLGSRPFVVFRIFLDHYCLIYYFQVQNFKLSVLEPILILVHTP